MENKIMLPIIRVFCGICIFTLLMNTFSFSPAFAEGQADAKNAIATSPGAKAAAATAEELAKNSQIQKKISNDIGSFMNSRFAHDHPSVVALPPDIMVYGKKFADQAILRREDIMQLDPAIEAVQVRFLRILKFDYNPNDPFVKKYGLDHLTPQQHELVEENLIAFPIIFRKEKMPLQIHYDCYITLFLNNEDSRVKNLQLPDREVWWDTDALIQEMLWPIQLNQVTAAQDPDLKQVPNNQANQLIANYKSYLQKTLKAPQARLVKSLSDWASKDPEKQAVINYDAHFINFFPGMNYLALQVPYCQVLDSSTQSRGVWLLIQKAHTTGKHARDFSAFHIPSAITHSQYFQFVKTANQSPNKNHYFIEDN